MRCRHCGKRTTVGATDKLSASSSIEFDGTADIVEQIEAGLDSVMTA